MSATPQTGGTVLQTGSAVPEAEGAAPNSRAPSERAPRPLEVPEPMLEACRTASLLIGGPGLSRLGVTSTLRGEGRTSIAMAMASIQRNDYNRTVALVDMDLENPTLARRHGRDPWPGLAEVATGKATLDQVQQRITDGISLVPGGVIAVSTSRTVADVLKADLLSELNSRFDVLIVDLPPLLGGGAVPSASRVVDNLVLVVRAGVTPVARIMEATADLHVTPAVVLNGSYSSLPSWLRRLVGR